MIGFLILGLLYFNFDFKIKSLSIFRSLNNNTINVNSSTYTYYINGTDISGLCLINKNCSLSDINYTKDLTYRFVYEGDSITYFASSYANLLPLTDGFFGRGINNNVANNGATTTDIINGYATNITPLKPAKDSDDFYLFLMAGINDLQGGSTALSTYNNLKAIWNQSRQDGFKLIASTVTPANNTWLNTQAKRNNWTELNNYILSDPTLYDYLIRPDLVASNSSDILQYSDGLHPTLASHINILYDVKRAMITKNVFDYLCLKGDCINSFDFNNISAPMHINLDSLGVYISFDFNNLSILDINTNSGFATVQCKNNQNCGLANDDFTVLNFVTDDGNNVLRGSNVQLDDGSDDWFTSNRSLPLAVYDRSNKSITFNLMQDSVGSSLINCLEANGTRRQCTINQSIWVRGFENSSTISMGASNLSDYWTWAYNSQSHTLSVDPAGYGNFLIYAPTAILDSFQVLGTGTYYALQTILADLTVSGVGTFGSLKVPSVADFNSSRSAVYTNLSFPTPTYNGSINIGTTYFHNDSKGLDLYVTFDTSVTGASDYAYVNGYVNGTLYAGEGILYSPNDMVEAYQERHNFVMPIRPYTYYSLNSTLGGSGTVTVVQVIRRYL